MNVAWSRLRRLQKVTKCICSVWSLTKGPLGPAEGSLMSSKINKWDSIIQQINVKWNHFQRVSSSSVKFKGKNICGRNECTLISKTHAFGSQALFEECPCWIIYVGVYKFVLQCHFAAMETVWLSPWQQKPLGNRATYLMIGDVWASISHYQHVNL